MAKDVGRFVRMEEDLDKEVKLLEHTYPDFQCQDICREALKLAVKRYKTDLVRVTEEIKEIEGKIDILEHKIDNDKKSKYNLQNRLDYLKKIKEDMEAEEEDRSPKMLFRNAVYRLSNDIGDYGAPDLEKADNLAEEIGVPVDLLVKTAEDLHYHRITLDEVEDKLPTLDTFLGK